MDFELEIGHFLGVGNPDAHAISVDTAASHIFGLVLLNDWSARDVQAFEYQPLGPFLSKSFATSISPWVVTLDALQPFLQEKAPPEVQTVTYLQEKQRKQADIRLQVYLQPAGEQNEYLICETNYRELYWTMEQMLAHHTINGCIMEPGDLFASGTISGPNPQSLGSLLEMTLNGQQALMLGKTERRFLMDGDTIRMSAYCEKSGLRIGFGSVSGTILPVK
jgi:fumarylacetoacetase